MWKQTFCQTNSVSFERKKPFQVSKNSIYSQYNLYEEFKSQSFVRIDRMTRMLTLRIFQKLLCLFPLKYTRFKVSKEYNIIYIIINGPILWPTM